jgi:hypothetical protein
VPCLSKPFSLMEVRQIVQRVLQAYEELDPAVADLETEPPAGFS